MKDDLPDVTRAVVQAIWNDESAEQVTALVASGAHPDVFDGSGSSALVLACFKGRPDLVDALLGNGATPDLADRQGTPLLALVDQRRYYAQRWPEDDPMWQRTLDMMSALLEAGADPNRGAKGGDSPLHRAVRLGWVEAADTLLGADADLDSLDAWRRTPETLAIQCELPEIAERLGGPDAAARAREGDGLVRAIKRDALLILRCHLALFRIEMHSIRWTGETWEEHTEDGTAGTTSTRELGPSDEGALERIAQLLRVGAPARDGWLRFFQNTTRKKGGAPEPFRYGDSFDLLHHLKAPSDLRDGDAVRRLLAEGADPNAYTERGKPALHKAWPLDLKRALLEGGAHVDARDWQGNTALSLAGSMSDVVELLLEAGADPDGPVRDGRRLTTPLAKLLRRYDQRLHDAVDKSAELLIRAGADLGFRDETGRSLSDVIVEYEYERAADAASLSRNAEKRMLREDMLEALKLEIAPLLEKRGRYRFASNKEYTHDAYFRGGKWVWEGIDIMSGGPYPGLGHGNTSNTEEVVERILDHKHHLPRLDAAMELYK